MATINLSLPGALLKKADLEAKNESRNRSELMREALRSYLGRKQTWNRIFDYAEHRSKKTGFKPGDVDQAIQEARKG